MGCRLARTNIARTWVNVSSTSDQASGDAAVSRRSCWTRPRTSCFLTATLAIYGVDDLREVTIGSVVDRSGRRAVPAANVAALSSGATRLGGRETFRRVAQQIWPALSRETSPELLDLVELPNANGLAKRRGERDRRLLDLLRQDRST